jgi:hypothetical protein
MTTFSSHSVAARSLSAAELMLFDNYAELVSHPKANLVSWRVSWRVGYHATVRWSEQRSAPEKWPLCQWPLGNRRKEAEAMAEQGWRAGVHAEGGSAM